MAKRERWELQQMQSLPLELKIRKSQERIKEWYEYWDGMVYISYSGGKDSTVLKHLVDSLYDDVPTVFVNTGLEYPEVQKAAIKNSDVVLTPKMNFKKVLQTYGYPIISKEISQVVAAAKIFIQDTLDGRCPDIPTTIEELKAWENIPIQVLKIKGILGKNNKPCLGDTPNTDRSAYNCKKYEYLLNAPFNVSNKCCNVMKKQPAHKYERESKRKPFIGELAEESRARTQAWMRTGCNAYEGSYKKSKPLSFWTEQDILQYLVENQLEIPEVYGEIIMKNDKYELTGVNRTGCVFCGYGCHLEKEPNRFQKLAKTHPKLYTYCIGGGNYVDGIWQPNNKGLGMGKVLDFIGVNYKVEDDTNIKDRE